MVPLIMISESMAPAPKLNICDLKRYGGQFGEHYPTKHTYTINLIPSTDRLTKI